MAWTAICKSNAPLLREDKSVRINAPNIGYQVINKEGEKIARQSMSGWKLGHPDKKDKKDEDFKKGWTLSGPLPKGLSDPVALLLWNLPSSNGEDSLDYISEIEFYKDNRLKVVFPIHSWVSSDHKDRVFFAPEAYLPNETPHALLELRKQDLKQLRGEDLPRGKLEQKRTGADRAYGYQVYDDLGSASLHRPALGDSAQLPYPRRIATNRQRGPLGSEVPVRQDPDKANPASAPWLPYDERFNFNKSTGFVGNTLVAVIPALAQGLKKIPPWKIVQALLYQILRVVPIVNRLLPKIWPKMEFPPVQNFQTFRDVLTLFEDGGLDVENFTTELAPVLYPSTFTGDDAMGMSKAHVSGRQEGWFKDRDGKWSFPVDDATIQEVESALAEADMGPAVMASASGTPAVGPQTSPASSSSAAVTMDMAADAAPSNPSLSDYLNYVIRDPVTKKALQDLFKFDLPQSVEGRKPEAWASDQEMGRQALAGMNPCTLAALKKLPEELDSAIRDEHVSADLQGHTLRELVDAAVAGEQPRLFIMDYWALSTFWDQMPDNNGLCQHAGRALFFLRMKSDNVSSGDEEQDDALIPVAIELAAKGKAATVYSRSKLNAAPHTQVVWRLAKAVFRSLDSSYHQLISHWLRTHACLEPFLIAFRRQMSIMHPVFKLMLPHFRYTLHINANARSSLVNAGGIIEQNFSAGEFAMRLSSEVYKGWRFRLQALPEDLNHRGMMNPATKRPWMEYPYGEDGLDLWEAFEDYFSKFLAHHYGNNGSVDADAAVAADVELQAWWDEVKNVGHGDLVKYELATEEDVWGFAGPIKTQVQLVRILVTIAWTASAHHAAVNFGQYDFSSLILNFSAMVRKPMPVLDSKEYKELIYAPMGPPQERVFLSYMAHVASAVTVMLTVKLLSGHAEDEQTLDKPNEYLKDATDKELNQEFIKKVQRLELDFEQRNDQPGSWTRAATKLNPNTMPYTLLLPSSDSGVTCRGVPYSVSI